jgi:hypothetical protein
MFATFEGKTTRPPISWCENCLQFRVSNPYVLCATNDSIKVYNLADSKLKQSIEFGPIRSMHYIEDENIIFLSTSNKVYALNPHSPANQINQLLENKRVNEALELFELLYKKLNSIEYDEVKGSIFHFVVSYILLKTIFNRRNTKTSKKNVVSLK